MSSVRELADSFHERWLQTHPFAASSYGIPGYDDRVPEGMTRTRAGITTCTAVEHDQHFCHAGHSIQNKISNTGQTSYGPTLDL